MLTCGVVCYATSAVLCHAVPDRKCSLLYALCFVPYGLCSMLRVLCLMLTAVCSVPYALCAVLYALCSVLYALCPLLYVARSICSMPYMLCAAAVCSMLATVCCMLYVVCFVLHLPFHYSMACHITSCYIIFCLIWWQMVLCKGLRCHFVPPPRHCLLRHFSFRCCNRLKKGSECSFWQPRCLSIPGLT